MRGTKRALSVFLSLLIVLGAISAGWSSTVFALESTGYAIFDRFISEPEFTDGVSWNGSQTSKLTSVTGYGCNAYCRDYIYYCYGYTHWASGTKFTGALNIRAGDIIVVGNPDTISCHWFICLKRSGNDLYTAEGDASGKVKIGWTRTIVDNSTITNTDYSFTYGYHYLEGEPITPCTTHTKGEYQFYEAVHPHYKCYLCSVCGEVFRSDETTYVSSCAQCAPAAVTVEEGVYVFHNVRDASMVLDIQNDSKERGANIQLFKNLYNQEQKFRVVNMGDYYCIQSVYSGMWLDISYPAENQDGCNIQLWDENTNREEKWIFEDAGNGNVYIHSLYGVYIDTVGGQTYNNTNIQTYHFDGTTSQQWKLERVAPGERVEVEEGVYVFHNVRNPDRVMDIQFDSLENGAKIQLYHNWYNQVEKFRVVNMGDYYCIQSVYSGLWLDISYPVEGKNGCSIQLWKENTNDEEKWIFEDAGNGNVCIRNYYEVYLDTGGSTDISTGLQTWVYDGSTSQQWKLVKTSPYPRIEIEDGVYTIHNAADPSKVFYIQDDSLASDANIQLNEDLNNNVQQFNITKHKDDTTDNYYYTIQSAYSLQWLDIALSSWGAVVEANNNIKLYYSNAYKEEKWVFEDAGNGNVLIRSLYEVYAGTENDQTDNGTNILVVDYHDAASSQWTLHRVFNVTYDANGGTDAPADQGKQQNINLTLRTDQPSRSGYLFTGWNTEEGGNGTTYSAGDIYAGNSDLILYAQWTKNAYTVSLDGNGGVCGITQISAYYNEPYGVLPIPTREGYAFNGWFLADGTPVTESTLVTTAEDDTLYARWTANTYLVTFDPNGGTCDTESKTVTFADAYAALPTATREGYTFLGWFTADGVKITAETIFTLPENQTLNAHWALSYVIHFDAMQGIWNRLPEGAAYDEQYNEVVVSFPEGLPFGSFPTVSRQHFTFAGWFTEPWGRGIKVREETILSPALGFDNADQDFNILYAYWIGDSYTVTFDANGGTCSIETKTYQYNELYLNLPIPYRDGYTFDDWYTHADGGTKITTDSYVTCAENHILYAHWKALPQIAVPAGSTAVIDEESGFIYGLQFAPTEDILNAEYLSVQGGATLDYKTASYIGTGTKVDVLNESGEVIQTYTIVIFGDMDGDGVASLSDIAFLKGYLTGAEEVPPNDPRLLAGDLDGDNTLTLMDISMMKGMMNGAVEYDQATRTAK